MKGIYWLASYPKSGNTWLKLALLSLEQDGAPVRFDSEREAWWTREDCRVGHIVSSRMCFDDLMNVESSDLTVAEVESLRPAEIAAWAADVDMSPVVKVHDAWMSGAGTPLFPVDATRGAVVIVRDPRDVAGSFADHLGLTVDAAIANMADTEFAFGRRHVTEQMAQRLTSWSGHVTGWLDAPVPKLVVRYEDMIADMPAVLAKVAAFVEMPAPAAAISRAVAETGFDRLRRAEEKIGFREKSPSSKRFFRQGRAGAWRDTLSPEQVRRIEADHGATMRRMGYRLECEAPA